MAKKNKVIKHPHYENEAPEEVNGLKRLKEGQEVFYKTPYIVEKTFVKEVNKKEKIAILDNQVRVSIGILPDGTLLKVGSTTSAQVVRIWDESSEKEYNKVLNKKSCKNILHELTKNIDNFNAEQIEFLHKKLSKVEKSILC